MNISSSPDFLLLLSWSSSEKDDHQHHPPHRVKERNRQWTDGVRSSVSRLFSFSLFSLSRARSLFPCFVSVCIYICFHSPVQRNLHTLTNRQTDILSCSERERQKNKMKKSPSQTNTCTVDRWIGIMKRVNLPLLMPGSQNTCSCT